MRRLLLSPIASIVLGIVGIGVSIASSNPVALVFAAFCFTLAAAVFIGEVRRRVMSSALSRATAFSTIAIVGMVLIALYGWLYTKAFAQTGTGDCNVGRDNYGSVSCHNNILNYIPSPDWHFLSFNRPKENEDGTFTSSAMISVDTTYVPGNMLILAKGDNLLSLNVFANGTSIHRAGKLPDGTFFHLIQMPFGKYAVMFQTRNADPIASFSVKFNSNG